MKALFSRRGVRPCLTAAAVCWLLAAFFRFSLIGYSILALMFFCIGVVILLYLWLPKAFRIALTVLLCLGVLLFLAAEIPVLRAAGGNPEMDVDYVIILGAGVNGAVPSLTMVNRLNTALPYLEAHPDCVAVVSGGQGSNESVTEAQAMYDWLTASGVDGGRIIKEERATSTKENLEYSLALIPDAGTATLAVVSSEYHLYRAEIMARQMGYTVYGIPARTTLPLLKVTYFIREALGVVHFWIFGY